MRWQFVDPVEVVKGVSREGLKAGRKMLIVAADEDKLMGVKIEADLAAWYREADPESGEEAIKEAVVRNAGHRFLLDTNWREKGLGRCWIGSKGSKQSLRVRDISNPVTL